MNDKTSFTHSVYPGQQILLGETPEWAAAARTSLTARGNSGDSRSRSGAKVRSAACARGGFEVAVSWEDQRTEMHTRLTSASIHSRLGNPVVLRLPMTLDSLRITPEGGEVFSVKPNAQGRFEFPTKAGGQYQLAW